jgi:rSAM/selenodomain-associated transferase 1
VSWPDPAGWPAPGPAGGLATGLATGLAAGPAPGLAARPAAGPGERPGPAAAQVIVIAKEPLPGRVKTRLTPALSPDAAARVAAAALADTLEAVAATAVARRVLVLDGAPGAWLPAGFDLIGQRGGGFDERLAAAFADCYATAPLPMVLIGMDTPQVTPDLILDAVQALVTGEADAVFGPAQDGGFWLLGLRRPDRSLLAGIPMSRPDTGRLQLERLAEAGLRVALAPLLTDVDTFETARQVARQAPGTRFTAVFGAAAGAGLAR